MPFSEKTIDFLVENRLQNSKPWFEQHREEYKNYVIRPVTELIERLAPVMHGIDIELIAEPKVGKSISRIYRDTRFSNDKSLYRDVMWAVFFRDRKTYAGYPGFFFELSPSLFRYGCGFYQADTKIMNGIRQLVSANGRIFQDALQAYKAQDVFSMEGEFYKRSKFPDMPPEMQNWADRKNIAFIKNSTDPIQLFSENLADKIGADFKLLAPIYNFLMKAAGIQ